MVVVEDSLTLPAPPRAVWKALREVPRWWVHYYHGARHFRDYGWGEELQSLGGKDAGMRWGALRQGTVMQTMRVEKWSPPLALVLASEPWNPDRAAVSLMKGMWGRGRLMRFLANINAVEFRVVFRLEAVPPGTRLAIRGEFRFLTPWLDPFFQFGAWPVIKSGTRQFVKKFPGLL